MAGLATYNDQDGHIYCEVHGDLGIYDQSVRQHAWLTTGEADKFLCLQCLGPEEGDPPSGDPGSMLNAPIEQKKLFE